jgi:hypothetical protein
MAEPIAIVAIITAVGALATITFKYVRHSECLGCFKCDTRTPPESPIAPPPPTVSNVACGIANPAPQVHHRSRKHGVSEDVNDENNIEKEIKETTIEIDV